MHVAGVLAAGVLAVSGWAQAQMPVGIPRALAQERAARVSSVRYELGYTLVPHAGVTDATETMRFQLSDATKPLLVDFRDGVLKTLSVNGKSAAIESGNGHVALSTALLHKGENTVEATFEAHVAPSEKAITRFDDADDGSEYIYTLFVPMDANMAFPCFDQPDLKARFTLTMTAPAGWTVISNTAPVKKTDVADGQAQTKFAKTEPISTYLFAFAAGPFVKVHPVAGLPGLYVRKSKAKAAESEAPEVQQTAADGMKFLARYFAQPFPFPKYDMVLIPGFAYGGMEHAGATFLREEAVLFRTAPTATNLLNRDIVVLHELTHQWFGDFTTMKWFDDLWLKEGFAQYMAYDTLAALKPQAGAWTHFAQTIKPAAYGIDETQGTTPIYQDIPNLKDAKSAYGAIVYSKAPAVIKQLAFVVGEENFRAGLRRYLAAHRYGNATWSDLIGAIEAASGQTLDKWADVWIRHRGMPRVDVTWSCASGNLDGLRLTQLDELGTDTVWPIATEVLLGNADGTHETMRVQFDGRAYDLAQAKGRACPAYVFANDGDYGYGLFQLDVKSQAYVAAHIGSMKDVLERTLLWGSLWQAVREADFAPEEYVGLAVKNLPTERDEALAASLIGHSETAIHRYVKASVRQELAAKMEAMAVERMVNDPEKDLRIVWFRALSGVSEGQAGRQTMRGLLDGSIAVPGVNLRQRDRWELIAALLAYGDGHAEEVLAHEEKADQTGDGKKFAYVAKAARPDAATKARYFDEYLHDPNRPEDWISESLSSFNYWNQTELTEPYLPKALAALEQIKRTRKIFFLVGWLNAFIDGQKTAAAEQAVNDYLKDHAVDRDLRLKILEAEDELQRTVKIRTKFAEE